MVKFPEAAARKIRNMFVCKKCSIKIRANNMKIIQGKVKCRKCQGSKFRPLRKK